MSSSEHALEFTEILKIQFEPIKIQMRIKNAKQSHIRRDLFVFSLSVLKDAKIVKVWIKISTVRQQPPMMR